MPLRRSFAALFLAILLALPAVPRADDAHPAPQKPEPAKAERSDKPAPFEAQRTVTRHNRAGLAYTAVTEFLPVREDGKDEALARIFTTTYTLDGAEPGKRPVAFVFNGGPGAASAYLHLGALGPRIVRFNDDGTLPRPPAPLIDNPDTWLRFTDLVFVDPVGTGYSRALKSGDDAEKRFWKPDADARTLAEIVRLWIARNERWASPKLLVGESYGGFRIAKMARHMVQPAGIGLNALIMVAPAIDFGTVRDETTGLLTAAFKLPAMAASAAAHGLVEGGDPATVAAQAERYALTDYLAGLATLDVGNLDASAPLFAEVARLTGLPAELVARHRGRVPAGVFARELLRGQGRVVSLYDGSFSGPDPDPGAPRVREDPFLTGTQHVYATAFTTYVQQELSFRTELPFHLLSSAVNRGWEWPREAHPSALQDLQQVLTLTPNLHLMIAHGRNDMVTPYLGSRWLAAQLELPAAERGRIRVPVYDGGHMMYTLPDPRARLAEDARALLDDALR
ncbi:MAG TPA: septum formation initiator [Azospirillum sp.]|nr:septum formation initiator [Azospirillum sp.]